MKKILILISFFTISLKGVAQKIEVPQNKVFNLDSLHSKLKNSTSTLTTNFAIYHSVKYPVYVSKNGKLFIKVTSKNGNIYNKYLKN